MNTITDKLFVLVSIMILGLSYGLRDAEGARLGPPPSAYKAQTDTPDPIDSNATLLGR